MNAHTLPLGKLYFTCGLPASGKSWWAKNWVDENPQTRARLNRDDFRKMLHRQWGGPGPQTKRRATAKHTERQITLAQHAAAEALLRAGIDVVIDDTNLEERHVAALHELAARVGTVAELVDFRAVPKEICLARNAARTGDEFVDPGWIEKMWREHIEPLGLVPA